MFFRVTNTYINQASRSVATGILVVGLMLVGFGTLILAMPEVFAMLAAMVFFVLGLGCAMTAVKILWTLSRLERGTRGEAPDMRENVKIHNRQFTEL